MARHVLAWATGVVGCRMGVAYTRDGPQVVQNRAKNTSNVHRSSHSYAHTMICYVVLIIQMHTIPTQAPNMCLDGDR